MYNKSIQILGGPMKATIVDLRYKMSDILKALDRRESVTILYHGRAKGTLVPANGQKSMKVADHPFFKMAKRGKKTVAQKMAELRRTRFDVI
jgi:antitoxin (DNA-binding transcriptional repressor) of toxin-antitoxin stability system